MDTVTSSGLQAMGAQARDASHELALASTSRKNRALNTIGTLLGEHTQQILKANRQDCEASRLAGKPEHYIERMSLTESRVDELTTTARAVAAAQDPVGEVVESTTRPNGLRVHKVRVPLGVVGVIYESRPNVTIDVSTLCIKSGNAVILRGGSECLKTNSILADICVKGLVTAGLPAAGVQFVRSADRALVSAMLSLDEYIDLIVPRGSSELVRLVNAEAKMQAVTGGVGVTHIYVDKDADVDKALAIVIDSKVSRPSVCNALDTLIVHMDIAGRFLPLVGAALAQNGVELRPDRRALSLLGPKRQRAVVKLADKADFGREFLGLILSIAVVDTPAEAIGLISEYGDHTDAIVTENSATADLFLKQVDSAAVIHNASTRFNDGAQFGLGGEVAVSTSKFHARGPVGMRELCSYKWVVRGDGQVRG